MQPKPTDPTAARSPDKIALLPRGTLVAFVVAVAAVLLIAVSSHRAFLTSNAAAADVTSTVEVVGELQSLLSNLVDAETGQRGFLLTGSEPYLTPYTLAQARMDLLFRHMRSLLADDPTQTERLATMEQLAGVKMAELAQTIALRRAGAPEDALAIVRTDRGKSAMDQFRVIAARMERDEQARLSRRQASWQSVFASASTIATGGSALLLLLIFTAAWAASRDYRSRETEIWLRSGQAGLNLCVQGDQALEALTDKVLGYLAAYLGAPVAAMFLADRYGVYRRVAGFGVPQDDPGQEAWQPGEGLVGQAARDNRAMVVRDVPQGYLHVASALGRARPAALVLAPASVNGRVHAVMEFGFFRPPTAADASLLDRVSEMLGVAVRSSKDRARLEELLVETQRQSEELQTQQEELRVTNEELEEQGNALRESQAQLELQQTELQQSNAHLTAQAHLLEQHRDKLSLSQDVLMAKAVELERTSLYKSEFLANMSHELRTPLNSTLILAKLLADNRSGNLTPEQVRFAQTISDAGNDLLTLINDILDLSKIESGMVDLQIERIDVARFVDNLVRGLLPAALHKGLALRSSIEPGTPSHVESDPQRLGQIVKNLLSNAVKFTERGEVVLTVSARPGGLVSFAVRDTGIGVAAGQHASIFEAFRQADGSTHRKYGGTGLGLSISRDLAQLLGGDIAMQSTPGEGSVFDLVVPAVHVAEAAATDTASDPDRHGGSGASGAASEPRQRLALPSREPPPTAPPLRSLPSALPMNSAAPRDPAPPPDDAARPDGRLILVIEDDARFAAILRDLAHEKDFRCIVATTAGEGVAAAIAERPNAIVLDVNLPDYSGLGVLDQLKHDPRTRHIPVHVLSVADYAREALELGAIGYDLKPVKRVQLVEALERLESKFSQRVRRVLVVEDDPRQRDSLQQLLAHTEVQVTAVDTAERALQELQDGTFDCMIMDLNLPDMTGDALLDRMAAETTRDFPPVIVYTGRALSDAEEQRLRRHSRSIIIKDARSPERLLDEVTLFLHQVESSLPVEAQRLLRLARDRDNTLHGRRILVVEDDVRNIFALTSLLEPKGATIEIARNGREALEALEQSRAVAGSAIDLVLMDIMMPEMDGYTAMREIRRQPVWRKLPIIALTAKAMKDDQEKCLAAGANDYIAKPLDVEKLLSLVRVWMPK